MWISRFLFLLLALSVILAFGFSKDSSYVAEIPESWPDPVYDFKNNPISPELFELGKKLFYDGGLSRDGSISCASCHSQFNSFTHVDHAKSHGIDDRVGRRNSPVLVNLAWQRNFHWDGGVLNLQMQPLNPIQDPNEMDSSLEDVLEYLRTHKDYPTQFYEAFGDSSISTKQFLIALEQFTVSLISSNSKYDQFMRNELRFSKQEKSGLKIFREHCSTCHPEPLFTSGNFANNGIRIDANDIGRFEITGDLKDKYLYKVPTLRNSAYSFPYMHDGSLERLQEVIKHYNSNTKLKNNYLSAELRYEMNLSERQEKDLLAFLLTLSDRSFMFNKKFMPN